MEGERGTGGGGSGVGLVRPMLATAGSVPSSPGWAFEVKFDGVRAIAYTSATGLRLFSRNDRDITSAYPDVTDTDLAGLGEGLVLDGELVTLDGRGRPDFGLLQHRMHVAHPGPELLERIRVQYVVFDILGHEQGSLLAVPYRERREVLVGLGLDGHGGLRVPANFTDTPGSVVMDAVAGQGLEGVVAKQLDSVYQPGKRVRSWIKTAIRHTHEVIVLGWSPGPTGRRELGALLLGVYDGAELVYVGDVGTGFTEVTRRHLLEQLRPLVRAGPPVAGEVERAAGWPGRAGVKGEIHWVEPWLVGEIEYRAFTRDGHFRHPSWRGLRPDRRPIEVRLPEPT